MPDSPINQNLFNAQQARGIAENYKQAQVEAGLKDICGQIAKEANQGNFHLDIDRTTAEDLWKHLHDLGYKIQATSSVFSLGKPYKLSWHHDPE